MRIILLILLSTFIFSQNLFISEYVEANSTSNTYLEIFNPTENSIDLSDYYMEVSRSSAEWGDTNKYNSGPYSGILNSGQILILARSAGTDLIEFGNDAFLFEDIFLYVHLPHLTLRL